MAQSKSTKKLFNMAYGIGAAIVILGALFKIMHFNVGPITGGMMLTIGMAVEAVVFAISAFEPVEDDLDWTKVYPELGKEEGEASGMQGMLSQKLDNLLKEAEVDTQLMNSLGESIKNFQTAAQGLNVASESISATQNYNERVEQAASKMESLNGLYQVQMENASKQAEVNDSIIENSERLKEQMESLASESISTTQNYNERVEQAASKMESLNGLYQVQMENASKQAEVNSSIIENSERLKEQMESLTTNLSSLNGVYGGMLSVMSSK